MVGSRPPGSVFRGTCWSRPFGSPAYPTRSPGPPLRAERVGRRGTSQRPAWTPKSNGPRKRGAQGRDGRIRPLSSEPRRGGAAAPRTRFGGLWPRPPTTRRSRVAVQNERVTGETDGKGNARPSGPRPVPGRRRSTVMRPSGEAKRVQRPSSLDPTPFPLPRLDLPLLRPERRPLPQTRGSAHASSTGRLDPFDPVTRPLGVSGESGRAEERLGSETT